MNRIKISENFMLLEFECHDGNHEVKIDEKLLEKLQRMREFVGRPIKVVSGYRTPEYNKKIGGATESYHMLGMAADIQIEGLTPNQMAVIAEQCGFMGIGIYSNFCHVDVRPERARWRG